MITLLKKGMYKLVETKHHARLLYIDGKVYAWVTVANVAEILVASHRTHKTDSIICIGEYRVYDVADEPHLSDQQHMELEVGQGHWQGYVLRGGLPDADNKRCRIIPTHELITGTPHYPHRKEGYVHTAGRSVTRSQT